jgi:DNA-binding transcriptional regulator YhcF (GntR family)
MEFLVLDPGSVLPPFEQVRSQIVAAIDSGQLEAGAQLPTVRKLAGDLGLAVNTVARAYREMEMAGSIETRGRHGSFIAGVPTKARRQAVRVARDFIQQMRDLGMRDGEVLAVLRREIERDLSSPGSDCPAGTA